MKKFIFVMLALCSFSKSAYCDLSWSSPVEISTALTDASDPHTVIDANGNATAVWVENNTIMASSLPSGGSWTTPVALSNPLNTSSNPLLSIDGSANVTALWIEDTQIESATLPFGSSWTAETSPISSTGVSQPVLVEDTSGNAVAIWVRSGFIESSTRISGTWSLVSVLSGANSDHPHVAISSFGTAMAVWHSVVSSSDALYSDILTLSSNTWAAPLSVFSSTAAYHHNYPKVALDPFGNAVIAWWRYSLLDDAYQNVEVLTTSLDQGTAAWGLLPTFLSNLGIRNPADLRIQLRYDSDGNALATWLNSYDGETFSIESSQKLFGGQWQPFIIVQGSTIYSLSFDTSASAGNVLLTNMAWDGVSSIIVQSQETDITNPVQSRWTIPQTISTGSENGYPKCAMALSVSGTDYNSVAVWLNNNGTNTVINASTGNGAIISPPSNVAATQNVTDLGVYNDYYNTVTWDASTDPDVIQYNIYRNGVIFTATDTSTFEVIDHNQTQGGTVTYGVTAFTSDFRQSPQETYTLFP